MKKLLALLLALMMMFSLFACGETAKPNDDADKGTNDGGNDDSNVVDADPLFVQNIKAAVDNMRDAKAFDISTMLTLEAKSNGIAISIPVKMAIQMKWTGALPESYEDLDSLEDLENMGLVMKVTCEITMPAMMDITAGVVKMGMYLENGIVYIDADGEKTKVVLVDAIPEVPDASEEIESAVDKQQVLAMIQALLKGVESPEKIITAEETKVDGGVNLSYTIKGTALYDYVKSALKTICDNADSEEVRAMIDALVSATEDEPVGDEEEMYTKEYDFDNIDWEDFFYNEMEMTVEEVKDMYIQWAEGSEDWSEDQWEAFFQEQYNPEAVDKGSESANDLYDQIYGEDVGFSFKDATFSVVLKNDTLASASSSFGVSLTQKATEPDQSDVTTEFSVSTSLTVNAIGNAVSISAPADLDSYVEMPSDFESSFEDEDEFIA